MLGSQLHLTWMLIASVYGAWSGRLKLSEFHPQEELSSGILWGRLILIPFSGLPHLIQISLTDFFFWHLDIHFISQSHERPAVNPVPQALIGRRILILEVIFRTHGFTLLLNTLMLLSICPHSFFCRSVVLSYYLSYLCRCVSSSGPVTSVNIPTAIL